MPQPLDTLKETPSQTAGPYVHIGLMPNFVGIHGVHAEDLGGRMCNDRTSGERIAIEGHVFDGTGEPLRDCVIEIWQADAAGLYPSPSETRGTADPNFTGWGRAAADPQTEREHRDDRDPYDKSPPPLPEQPVPAPGNDPGGQGRQGRGDSWARRLGHVRRESLSAGVLGTRRSGGEGVTSLRA